jgi:anti-sigma-K factor RskA
MSERPQKEHEERWLEQAAAYSLGTLDRSEVPEFEGHLEGCEVCRSEIRWLRPAVDALPESVPLMAPPPDLRERLLKDVRADARGTQRRRSADAAEERLTFGAWLARLGSRGWKPLAAAGAAALVVFAFVGYEVGSNGGGSDNGGGAPVAVTIPAPRSPEGITSQVVKRGNRATVQLANVKQLPDDRVLEAWVLRNEQVEPVRTLFVPDKHGDAATEIPNLTGVETVMVTREPKGGSASPTSAPIATIPLPQT